MNTYQIELNKLHPFPENPYHVTDNEEMEMLINSIKSSGIIEPLIVRPDGDSYEIISGHRRFHACQKVGIEKIPVFIIDSDREAAKIILVDSNLHRDGLLPSEKAFAYKLKFDALNHQGKKTFGQDVAKSEYSLTQIANTADVCEKTIQRYIRLTYLIPELLRLVDDKKMAITPAVEISYIPQELQKELLVTIESEQAVPSLSQAQRMRKLASEGNLNTDRILEIMCERKCNQREPLKISADVLNKYFRPGTTPKRMQEIIEDALTLYAQKQKAKKKSCER